MISKFYEFHDFGSMKPNLAAIVCEKKKILSSVHRFTVAVIKRHLKLLTISRFCALLIIF